LSSFAALHLINRRYIAYRPCPELQGQDHARDQDIECDVREQAELVAAAKVLSACAHLALLDVVNVQRSDSGISRITRQEREVIRWVAAGKTGWEIGRILSISEPTVAFHVKNAMQKLDAKNRPQMVAVAFRAGLID